MFENTYIDTNRCILRCLKDSDSDELFITLGDSDVFKYIPYDKYSSVDDVKKSIKEYYVSRMEDGSACEFGIEMKDSGIVIGTCGFMIIDDGIGVLAYMLHKDYWNKGIMSEVVKSVIDFGFSNIGLERIIGYCMVENIASKSVLIKNGFSYVGDSVLYTENGSYNMSNYILDKGV